MGLFGIGKPKGYFVPNLWGKIIWTTAEEMLGSIEFGSIQQQLAQGGSMPSIPPDNMKKEISFAQISQCCAAIRGQQDGRRAEDFGLKAGSRMIVDTIGRAKSVAVAAQMATRVGSLDGKAKLALEFFSKFITSISDEAVNTGKDQSGWTWTVTRCPYCWERQESSPCCHISVGMAQGVMNWLGPETRFNITEEECIAAGGRNCVVRISNPMSG